MSEQTIQIIEELAVTHRNTRRSILSRRSKDRDCLLRFVRDPDGRVIFDVDERLPGRGFWLESDRASVELAVKRQALQKVAGSGSSVAGDLAMQIEQALVRRALDRLGLARRAGVLVSGFDEVFRAVREGRAKLAIQASDGANDGLQKISRIAGNLPIVRLFDRFELGKALGRDEAVHLVMTQHAHAACLLTIVRRLAGFRRETLDQADMMTLIERQERFAS